MAAMFKVRSHLHFEDLLIWVWAFGYFACYVPYSALTKTVTGPGSGLTGLAILPITTMVSLVGAAAFIAATGWWRSASQFSLGGISLPRPGRWTFLSGLCSAAIIGTTTLAYTFEGTSIVFMMLWMRGGVLVIAPVVDLLTGRKVRHTAWAALLLSFAAVSLATRGGASLELSGWAMLNIAVYLLAYFIRLQFMSRMAKSADPESRKRYFVEEQLVATPAIVLAVTALALWGQGPGMLELRSGFTEVLTSGTVGWLILIGLCSQGTGVFGALILLDARENAFSVPVNRASSIIAGVLAGYLLHLFAGAPAPGLMELLGAGLVIAAMVLLSVPGLNQVRNPSKLEVPPPAVALDAPENASTKADSGHG